MLLVDSPGFLICDFVFVVVQRGIWASLFHISKSSTLLYNFHHYGMLAPNIRNIGGCRCYILNISQHMNSLLFPAWWSHFPYCLNVRFQSWSFAEKQYIWYKSIIFDLLPGMPWQFVLRRTVRPDSAFWSRVFTISPSSLRCLLNSA